jgi:hypothetical protein
MTNKRALALPDALLIRYYRAGEIGHITKVTKHRGGRVTVQIRIEGEPRTDRWQDLGGGIGYVPTTD